MRNYIEIETNFLNDPELVKADFTLYDIEEHFNDINREINLTLTLENYLPHNKNLNFEEIALHIENDYILYNNVPFSDFLDYEILKMYNLDFKGGF